MKQTKVVFLTETKSCVLFVDNEPLPGWGDFVELRGMRGYVKDSRYVYIQGEPTAVTITLQDANPAKDVE